MFSDLFPDNESRSLSLAKNREEFFTVSVISVTRTDIKRYKHPDRRMKRIPGRPRFPAAIPGTVVWDIPARGDATAGAEV